MTRIHPAARLFATEHKSGRMGRREFLSRATALGVSAPLAYGLIGLAAPSRARAEARQGGTLRVNMETKAMKDPRLWDWSEHANFGRGWLEYLAEFNRDGSVTPSLAESWEANEDATQYVINLRQGVTWNNGDPFTAQDVAFNFARWAEPGVEGNSMATRVAALIDEAAGALAEGAVEVVDEHTLRLNLSRPDIALIAALSDYPAALVHPSYDGGDPTESPIGTGAYLPVVNDVGVMQVLERNPDHGYWKEGAYLDRIEYIDLGTDSSAWFAAADSGEIDLVYESRGEFVDAFDAIGWEKAEVVTANTICVRFNQDNAPYDEVGVRNALQLAVDNALILELALGGRGIPGENHHVAPIHPEYAELPPLEHDPERAAQMIADAGHADTEFELISIDTEWQANTCNAVAAQLREAGINVKRTILPGSTFWNDWTKYPWSATEWGPRPLGVQVLSLAYKSGVPWNETAFSNAEFDSLLEQASSVADADARREIMERIQTIMQEEGVVIQPFWRSLYNHQNGTVGGADIHPFFYIFPHEAHFKA